MAYTQYFDTKGQVLSAPISTASYARVPVVGDLVHAGTPAVRMQVVGCEHRSTVLDGTRWPLLALFLTPYAAQAGHPNLGEPEPI